MNWELLANCLRKNEIDSDDYMRLQLQTKHSHLVQITMVFQCDVILIDMVYSIAEMTGS